MKKSISIFLLFILVMTSVPVYALNIGTYQTETEYGLLDGFKINWKRKNKSEPFIDAREESTKLEKEKDLKNYKENEYEYTRYMYDGKAIL